MGKTESFEFLNELALAFRRGEKHARPQHAPILEGIRAVLAHLHSTDRLLSADEMPLTAEQVKGLKFALEAVTSVADVAPELRGALSTPISRLVKFLRALFPATEPGEEVKPVKFRKMTPKYATANFGFPDVTVDPLAPFTRWAYKDSDGDKWVWNGDQWELHVVPPAPAEPAEDAKPCGSNSVTLGWCKLTARHEGLHTNGTYLWGTPSEPDPPAPAVPAEEETKAEYPRTDGDFTVLGPEIFTDATGEFICWKGVNYVRQPDPTSSPVVPAPTETGPWQTWGAVPIGQTVRAANGERFRKNSVGAIHLLTNGDGDCCQVDTVNHPLPAPFTAVEEES